jgi:PGF-CTERM protein
MEKNGCVSMKKVILIALLLFSLLSCLSVNVAGWGFITKIATPAALEPGENLTIDVIVEAGEMEDLYSVEIRDKVPEGFELISGNTSIMDYKSNSVFREPVELSYVLKALKPGVFLLEPAKVTYKRCSCTSLCSSDTNRFEVYVIDPTTMTLNSEADSSTYPYTLLLFYHSLYHADEQPGYNTIHLKTPEVLTIDKRNSYILNLETGSKLTYEEFLHSDQFEGDKLEFNISMSKSLWAGLWDRDEDRVSKYKLSHIYIYPSEMFFGVDYGYNLELSTNLDHPKWKFGDFTSYGQKVRVLGLQDYEREVPRVILFGTVPKQILTPEVHVTLTVRPQDIYGDLRDSIHKLEPVMEFSSISKSIPSTPISSPFAPTSIPQISTPSPTVTSVHISPTPMSTPTPTATAKKIPTPEEGVPGFEAIFAIVGLLTVASLLRRRK